MSNYPYISIIGKHGCPYTVRAIQACNTHNLPYATTYVTPEQARQTMEYYKHYTLPIVTLRYPYDEEFIGGSDNLVEFIDETMV